MPMSTLSRRTFLAMSATLPWAFRSAASATTIPVGLELYSVRDALKQDPDGTLRAVAKMGYQVRRVLRSLLRVDRSRRPSRLRKLLDDLGIRCYSTHNDADYFSAEKHRPRARLQSDSRQQICGAGLERSQDRRRWLEGNRGHTELRRRHARALRS